MANSKRFTHSVLGASLGTALMLLGCVTNSESDPQARGRSRLISPQQNLVAPAGTGDAHSMAMGSSIPPIVEYNRPKTIYLGPADPAPGSEVSAAQAGLESHPPVGGLVVPSSDYVVDGRNRGVSRGPATTVSEGLPLGSAAAAGVVGVIVDQGTAGAVTSNASVTTSAGGTSAGTITAPGIAGTATSPGIAGPLSQAAVTAPGSTVAAGTSGAMGAAAAGQPLTAGVAGTVSNPGVAGPASSRAIVGTGVSTSSASSATTSQNATTQNATVTAGGSLTIPVGIGATMPQTTVNGQAIAPAISSAQSRVAISNSGKGRAIVVQPASRSRAILGLGSRIGSALSITGRGRAITVTPQQ